MKKLKSKEKLKVKSSKLKVKILKPKALFWGLPYDNSFDYYHLVRAICG